MGEVTKLRPAAMAAFNRAAQAISELMVLGRLDLIDHLVVQIQRHVEKRQLGEN